MTAAVARQDSETYLPSADGARELRMFTTSSQLMRRPEGASWPSAISLPVPR